MNLSLCASYFELILHWISVWQRYVVAVYHNAGTWCFSVTLCALKAAEAAGSGYLLFKVALGVCSPCARRKEETWRAEGMPSRSHLINRTGRTVSDFKTYSSLATTLYLAWGGWCADFWSSSQSRFPVSFQPGEGSSSVGAQVVNCQWEEISVCSCDSCLVFAYGGHALPTQLCSPSGQSP